MPTDPVTIYKDGKQKSIAAVDLTGWVVDGWSTTIAVPGVEEVEPPEIDVVQPPKPTKIKPLEVTKEKSIELKK